MVFRPRWFAVLAVALGVTMLAGACTLGDEEANDDKPGIVQLPDAEEEEREPEGVETLPTDLTRGQCFNQYEILLNEGAELLELTTEVDCRRPHDGQVYRLIEHPAEADEPYPGNEGMELWARLQCYELFAGFVGIEYELSVLQVGTLRPDEESWDAGPYRGVHCYVFSPDGQLSGYMGGSEL